MKIRTDFVTNSSSSSFCVAITVNGKDGSSHKLLLDPADEYVGGGGEASLHADEKKIFGAENLEALLTYLTDSVVFEDADCAFDEFDVNLRDCSVKALRKALERCEEPYFRRVMADIAAFRSEVLEAIADLGQVSSVRIQNIHNAWGEFSDLLENYLGYVGIEVPEEGESWIGGKTFVVTGKLKYFSNREELVEFIEDEGGTVTGSVSQKTDYLINNDPASASAKNKKAAQLGIPVITEQEFIFHCDPDLLDDDILEAVGEFPDTREQTMAMLKKILSPDSSFQELANCIEEYCEPGSYQGEESELYDLENKTVQSTVTITI